MCSVPTSLAEAAIIIRGRITPTGSTEREFIEATIGADIPITVTIPGFTTTQVITGGLITPGRRRFTTDGAGVERRGMAIMAAISRPIPSIPPRHSGSPIT